jgi:hypothetical protein
LLVFLIVLHVPLYALTETYSAATVGYAIIWSAISAGIYAAVVSFKPGKTLLAAGISSSLVFAVYFLVYVVLVFPSFIELRILGYEIVHLGVITHSGIVYLILASIAEGLLLLVAASILKLLRHFGLVAA